MQLIIREMFKNDWEQVEDIYLQGIETGHATFQQKAPTYEEWDKSRLKKCRYVAIIDNKIVGWVALSPVSSREVYAGVTELSIYIDNTYKGMGVATRLITHIINESERNGIWTIQAVIIEGNEGSVKLHKKCGFREVGYREKIAKDKNGIWRNTILMERRSEYID